MQDIRFSADDAHEADMTQVDEAGMKDVHAGQMCKDSLGSLNNLEIMLHSR